MLVFRAGKRGLVPFVDGIAIHGIREIKGVRPMVDDISVVGRNDFYTFYRIDKAYEINDGIITLLD